MPSTMSLKLLGWAALPLLAPSVACAQESAEKKEESITAKVDAVFAKIDTTVTPGCALSVMKDGKIIYKRGYGMADLNNNIPNTPPTVFHVASMSKQFAAASIAMLALDGKISLDDPVQKYITELHDFGTPITVRELVYHTTGLRDQWELLNISGWRYSLDLITDDDVLSVVSKQKELNFPPNTRWMYSNTGYTLLSQIVKRVSGQSLREFTTTHIFEPLHMDSTHFRDDHAEILKNFATGYEQKGDAYKISITNFDTVGATSLLTTVEDLQKWDENFYHPQVGGPAFLKQILERGRLNNGEQLTYAFGLMIGTYRGLNTVDHGGADAGYRSDLIRFPDQHFSVACLCNYAAANPSDFTRKVADIYLANVMKPEEKKADAKPVKLSESQLKSKTGMYLLSSDDAVIRIFLKDGELRSVNGVWDEGTPLKPLSENHFQLTAYPQDFIFTDAKAGEPRKLRLEDDFEKPREYTAVDEFKPTEDQLRDFAGFYSSDEVEALYEFRVEKGKLTLHRLRYKPGALEPAVKDLFVSDAGSFHFTRDAAGHVDGFKLSTGRILNLRFKKGRPAIAAQ